MTIKVTTQHTIEIPEMDSCGKIEGYIVEGGIIISQVKIDRHYTNCGCLRFSRLQARQLIEDLPVLMGLLP